LLHWLAFFLAPILFIAMAVRGAATASRLPVLAGVQELNSFLERLAARRDRLYVSMTENTKLRNNILLLQEQKLDSIRTMVHLGSQVFVQADVPDTSAVYISIGLGFHLSFSLPEAVSHLSSAESSLQQEADELTARIEHLRSMILLKSEQASRR
jgi:prefoldin alpha subunit